MTRILSSLSDISEAYDALFVDLWGCVHDGVTAFPEAVAALQAYRRGGGTVVLLTNSPKPRAGVEVQILKMGVPVDAWDTIATSGDSARAAMFRGAVGRKIWFMGEWDRDAGFFTPMDILDAPEQIELVELKDAEGIVCCGPFDPDSAMTATGAFSCIAGSPRASFSAALFWPTVSRSATRSWKTVCCMWT